MSSSGRLFTTADILDGTIGPADIAANAATKVHAQNSLASSATNSPGPNTLLDITLTSSGGYFVAMAAGVIINNTAATGTQLYIKVDAGADVWVAGFIEAVINYQYPLALIYPIGVIAPGAGHHVYLRWGCGAGTTTTISAGYFTLLELIR